LPKRNMFLVGTRKDNEEEEERKGAEKGKDRGGR
jgi:hypothetical protein